MLDAIWDPRKEKALSELGVAAKVLSGRMPAAAGRFT
jgi:hypothetical protein